MTAFEESLPMLLYRALDEILPAYRELFAHYDITEQQWRVLRVIWSNQNVTSADLSRASLLSSPSLVSMIDRLEKKQLVIRVRSDEDRRLIYIVATDKGRALQDEVIPQVTFINEQIRAAVTDDEWHALQLILKKITDVGRYVSLPPVASK